MKEGGSGPGTHMAALVCCFSPQETGSRGRTLHQCSCPRGQEKAQPRFWGLQLVVAGWPLWILVGTWTVSRVVCPLSCNSIKLWSIGLGPLSWPWESTGHLFSPWVGRPGPVSTSAPLPQSGGQSQLAPAVPGKGRAEVLGAGVCRPPSPCQLLSSLRAWPCAHIRPGDLLSGVSFY